MLPKRIESWFRLLFNHMPAACPVLVTTTKQAMEELFESLRGKEEPAGKMPEPARIPLGSSRRWMTFPSRTFSACSATRKPPASSVPTGRNWKAPSSLPVIPPGARLLSQAADTLQDYLHHYRRELGLSAGRKVSIDLVLDEALKWHALREHFAPAGRPVNPAEQVSLDESVKVLACHFG